MSKTQAEFMGEIFSGMSAAQGELLGTLLKDFENRAHLPVTFELADLERLDDVNLKAMGTALYLALGVLSIGLSPDKYGAADIANDLPAICYKHLYSASTALARIKATEAARLDVSGYN